MAHYWIYGRHSDKGNQAKGSSRQRQTDLTKHRKRVAELSAKLAEEIELVEVPYYDDGKSGFKGDNLKAELGRMKDDIQAGTIKKGDIICVESHSRLGRLKPPKAIMQYLGFLRGGIRLDIKGKLRSWRSINGEEGWQTLTDDLSDMFVAHKESLTKAKYARDTNDLKRSKLREGIKESVMHGGTAGWFVGGRCPAWLKPLSEPDPKGYLYQVIESVADVIRLIFDFRESGLGCYRIAERLIEMRVQPLRNAHIKNPEKLCHKGWSHSMVARVLRNEAVIGRYQPMIMNDVLDDDGELIKQIAVPEGDPRDDYYPPIITLNQWRRVRALIERADKSGGAALGGRTGKYFTNIVKGLSTCPFCDGPVNLWTSTPKGGKARRELKCEHARRKMIFPEGHRLAGQRCPNRRGFPYPAFEAALFSLFRPNMIPVLAEMIPHRQRDELVTRRLSDCETKIAEHEQAIKRLVRLASKADEDEIADAYDAEARTVQSALKRLRIEHDRFQQQANSHIARYEEQIAAILPKLTGMSDPDALYEIRARLNQLLGRHICIMLDEGRVAHVNINAHSGLAPVIARITPSGLDAIDVIGRDGSVLVRYEAGALTLLEPIKVERDEAGNIISANAA